MSRDAALIIAVLLALAFAVGSVSAEEGEDGDGSEGTVTSGITVYGYVSNISDEEMNVPLSGVTVELLDSEGDTLDACETGSDGMFEFTYAEDSGASMLRFELTGYTVRTLPSSTMSQADDDDDNLVSFSIEGVTPDEDGRYRLSGDGTSASPVGMAATTGPIFGRVVSSDDGEGISGATVVFENSDGMQTSVETGPNGYFETTLPYGTYTLTASCNGFTGTVSVVAGTSSDTPVTITLTPNEFGIDILGGIDMPHAMMLIGLVLIGLVTVVVLFIIHRSRTSGLDVTVVNDLAEYEDDEGLEHP